MKLGFDFFTFLSVYIVYTFPVPIFAAWWRRYIVFRGIRFEGSAVAKGEVERREGQEEGLMGPCTLEVGRTFQNMKTYCVIPP